MKKRHPAPAAPEVPHASPLSQPKTPNRLFSDPEPGTRNPKFFLTQLLPMTYQNSTPKRNE